MGDRKDDKEAANKETASDEASTEERDVAETGAEADEDAPDEDEDRSDEDEDQLDDEEKAADEDEGEVVGEPAEPAVAKVPLQSGTAGSRPSALVRFFWMPEQVKAARAEGFDQDKPGWSFYELAREAMVAAQRLGELSEAKHGVMLLNREALVLMSRVELARADAEGSTWSDFKRLPSAKPMLEKLPEDELLLLDQVLAPDGVERLAKLPKDRRATIGKALATVSTKFFEKLEREANRVASVLYVRWLKIVGALVLILLLVGGVYALIKSNTLGPNLATGAKVQISSNSRRYGVPPERVVDGNRTDLGFHTNSTDKPWVQLDLGSEKHIRRVVVYNRPTHPERAVPLTVQVSKDGREFVEVAKKTESFSVWEADFASKKARFVKLEKQDKGFLHLSEIEVY